MPQLHDSASTTVAKGQALARICEFFEQGPIPFPANGDRSEALATAIDVADAGILADEPSLGDVVARTLARREAERDTDPFAGLT